MKQSGNMHSSTPPAASGAVQNNVSGEHRMVQWMMESTAETERLGRVLGQLLRAHAQSSSAPSDPMAEPLIVALHGELGAGKTTLTQGIAAGMGIYEPITSPTFTLINEYETEEGIRLLHVDGYRLGGGAAAAGAEAVAMGLDDLLLMEDGVIVIEWAERVAELLPADHLDITLRYVDEAGAASPVGASAQDAQRHLICRSGGPVSAQLVQALADRVPPNWGE
jgi:tRNA threonylcarbamoyladenosine biosynthesis protein TsaE